MADPSPDEEQTLCQMAIADVTQKLPVQFPQYPDISLKFKTICDEEAFDEIEGLLDDVAEGFKESVILEGIMDDIQIKDEDKEPLCTAIHTLLSNFEPSLTLNLVELETKVDKHEIESMVQLVEEQATFFKPKGKKDYDLLKVLVIGHRNNFPLLTYLLDTHSRCRLLEYDNLYKQYAEIQGIKSRRKFITGPSFGSIENRYKMHQFVRICTGLKNIKSAEVLEMFESSLHSALRRAPSSNPLPMSPQQLMLFKINDSIAAYATYYMSILSAVHKILKDPNTKLPQQIDFWVIPKAIQASVDDDDDDDDDDKSDDDEKDENQRVEINNLEQRLKFADHLVQETVVEKEVGELSQIFVDVLGKVVSGKRSKRSVMIVDRRGSDKNGDDLYAFLPRNSQNIASDKYLHEVMFSLSGTEVLPSSNGKLGKEGDAVHVGTADAVNMCLLSIHIHSNTVVRAYWYFNGSYTRWFINDMVKIWPLYFIGEGVDENGMEIKQDVTPIVDLIKKNEENMPLRDDNFDKFFEINTNVNSAVYST